VRTLGCAICRCSEPDPAADTFRNPGLQRKLCDIKPSSHWPCWGQLQVQAAVPTPSWCRKFDSIISPYDRFLRSLFSQVRAVLDRSSPCRESSRHVRAVILAAGHATPVADVPARRCNRLTRLGGCEAARWELRKSIRLAGYSDCRAEAETAFPRDEPVSVTRRMTSY
jgi:hypothetical protein